jgi:hypothetical protein
MTVWKQRVRYWTALALLRCVMSSPAAAEATLRARIARLTTGDETVDGRLFADYVLDLSDQEVPQDFEPTPVLEEGEAQLGSGERQRLQSFARRAGKLRGDHDPKLLTVVDEIAKLLRDGFRPIVYCRYIATADYLAAELQRRLHKEWPDLHVVAVTGAMAEEEREQRVAELSASLARVLVATDCLSEGINLQHAFDAVLHYDLPWNPNRLEQREGRVDRYGQLVPVVRVTLLYGIDNPIDIRVLDVLLRKARSIQSTLGISVPLPVDSESVVETVVRSLFQEQVEQVSMFDDEPLVQIDQLHHEWDRAAAREKESRSRFAQHAIKPEEVAQELYESDVVLGSPLTVATFVRDACDRLGAPLVGKRPKAKGKTHPSDMQKSATFFHLPFTNLPEMVRERIAPAFAPKFGAKPPDELPIGFDPSLPEGVHLIGRLHPLTEALAEYLLDSALEEHGQQLRASSCGAMRSTNITRRTTLLLLRVRLLIETADRAVPQLAEELIVAGFEGRPGNLTWLDEATARELLDTAQSAGNLAHLEQIEAVRQTLGWLPELEQDMNAIASARAVALLEAHRRVRQATHTGRVTVRPNLPLDVLGVYVLMPVPKGIAASL